MSSVLDDVADEVEPARIMQGTNTSVVLSIDVGTSGVRAGLFDERGREVPGAQAYSRQPLRMSNLGEFYPNRLVNEVIDTIDRVPFKTPVDHIAISAFWHSLIGVDEAGNNTTMLLGWADTRAAQFANELRSQFNEPEIHTRTGCRFHPSYWPAKLRWLKHEQPDKFNLTRCWLGFAEFLCMRLFGESATYISIASATGLFNQRNCDWDWDFVDALGIARETLPTLKTQTDARLTDEFASRWPALAEARLITVVGDGAANNIGAGCSTKDKIALMVGTSGAMRVVYAGGPPAKLPSGLWCYKADRGRVVVGGALSDGGGVLQWMYENLELYGDNAAMEKRMAELEPDAHGLTVLPFWSGERSTGWNGEAQGGIFGLRQETRSWEIMRAVLESIAYRFALIARGLDEVAPNATIVASGNALRYLPQWVQIIADVLGRPVLFGGVAEASSRGAALLALEAVGKIASIEEDQFVVDRVFEPDLTRHERYQQGLARQEKLYQQLYDHKRHI
jgi:gluconokinase